MLVVCAGFEPRIITCERRSKRYGLDMPAGWAGC